MQEITATITPHQIKKLSKGKEVRLRVEGDGILLLKPKAITLKEENNKLKQKIYQLRYQLRKGKK